ncbi:MAG: hypothetical protein KAV00_07165 [Phycisphaerae bacterium]|nr:hypothetical protein [Phycisphaerae bacterium]
MSKDKFDPFVTGAMHNLHAPRWELEQDFAEPTLDIFSSGKHLPVYSANEDPEHYAYRCTMSAPLDMCQDAIRIRIDNILRIEPKREVGGKHKAIIEGLIHDATNSGITLNEFMRRALWSYYATGCDIITQVTSTDARIETQADVKAANLRPYFLLFNPLQRYDWATDGSGNFRWARYCLGNEPAADEDGSGGDITHFLTLTEAVWRKHRAERTLDESGKGDNLKVETEEGFHSFGHPPIIKFYFAESQKPEQGAVPLSLISRPAMIGKVALNLKSQADVDLFAAVARWMFAGVENPPSSFGPMALYHTTNPEAKLTVVQGDVQHIREKREWLVLYLLEILRLLKFRGGMGDVEGNAASGVKLALEMTDLQNELRATASFLEQTELEMMRQAVILITGKDLPPEKAADELQYTVHYNRDYILEPVKDMLANIKVFVNDCGLVVEEVPEMAREMLRQLQNMLVRDGSPASVKILDEIENADLSMSGMKEAE